MKSDKNDKEIVPAATKIAVFRGKEVRKTIHNNEWWFVIEDVVAILTDSIDPKGYIKDMRRRDEELAKGWGQIATILFSSWGNVRSCSTKGWIQNVHTLLLINNSVRVGDLTPRNVFRHSRAWRTSPSAAAQERRGRGRSPHLPLFVSRTET
jgi:hypothetical protein